MRKFLFAMLVLCCGFAPAAHADKMVNVEYIHKLIEQRWDITIPYSPKLSTPKVAANMKYLLTLVDMTNKRINGTATTHYGDGEFATMAAADTVAANRAITKLARIKPKFTITTTPDTTEFTFRMSAKGRFMVDWGDNTATQIVRDNTELTPYTHTYRRPGEYKIKMTGRATGYATAPDVTTTISFSDNQNIAGISGSLGQIFSTIDITDDTFDQPRFYNTFSNCTNLGGTIPPELFTGLHGKPITHMFRHLFSDCKGLGGSIPENLFADLAGAPQPGLFWSTFNGCSNLDGSIPEKLFAKIQGEPQYYTFMWTFSGCSNLTGKIPENLFGGIRGAPQMGTFEGTFAGCRNLSGPIPDNLFVGIHGAPALAIFRETFKGCSNLDGSIPPKLFGDIKGAPANEMFMQTFNGCSKLSGPIPADLFGDIYGPAAYSMFMDTFNACSNLTGEIPAGLFGKISGPAVDSMYFGTFYGCINLTGCVPDGLFGDVGMTLDEIIAEYTPFRNTTKLTKEYCSVSVP